MASNDLANLEDLFDRVSLKKDEIPPELLQRVIRSCERRAKYITIGAPDPRIIAEMMLERIKQRVAAKRFHNERVNKRYKNIRRTRCKSRVYYKEHERSNVENKAEDSDEESESDSSVSESSDEESDSDESDYSDSEESDNEDKDENSCRVRRNYVSPASTPDISNDCKDGNSYRKLIETLNQKHGAINSTIIGNPKPSVFESNSNVCLESDEYADSEEPELIALAASNFKENNEEDDYGKCDLAVRPATPCTTPVDSRVNDRNIKLGHTQAEKPSQSAGQELRHKKKVPEILRKSNESLVKATTLDEVGNSVMKMERLAAIFRHESSKPIPLIEKISRHIKLTELPEEKKVDITSIKKSRKRKVSFMEDGEFKSPMKQRKLITITTPTSVHAQLSNDIVMEDISGYCIIADVEMMDLSQIFDDVIML